MRAPDVFCRTTMRLPSFLLLAVTAATVCAADERPLFNGTDLSGWRKPLGTWAAVGAVKLAPASPKTFVTEPGQGVYVNNPAGKTNDLLTEMEHGDCELHVEFCVPKDSNSGVYLQGRYEVQILDSFGKKELQYGDCGGIYACAFKGATWHGKAPAVNASKAPGEWQSFDITFHAPRFGADGKKTESAKFLKVVHNGQVVQENVEVEGPTNSASFSDEKPLGPLKLQGDHGPVAYRNLRIKVLP